MSRRNAPSNDARYCSPEVGRFISADTIVSDPSNPQDINRHTYVRNNPVAFIDPSGHSIDTPDDCTYDEVWSGGLC